MNKATRFKRGDKNHSNGMVFYRYSGSREVWLDREDFEKYMARNKARNEKHYANRDKHSEKERQREFRKNNPDKCREYSRRWRQKNPKLCIERSLESRAKKLDEYREKERERMRKYRSSNRHKVRIQASIHNSKRRAAIRGARLQNHSAEIEGQLRLVAARLGNCLGVTFHVDHITPISRGGTHHHLNMRVIPARLNQIKYNRADTDCPPSVNKLLKCWTP